ncbi:sigma-54-dependent transcriptional regulator [Paremcibacter congregatus]|uniref:Sigma-54-dependent Fis family transcriptional regulator n=1 Tax=Paremcibacter congregatus TaxID=2043170 RepID=A0A2G4YNI9_9PROT|nr:sigma-54 dependent transcriptional regulator [Paremcibacter congregatus]PHZ83880.1 sigma-54-dependent Fis family transcriptional regulator [Paremcibacter congregatus]QDE27584.1 sigma-54-dependent Fis family transcriptional regulator [Paremcibacter congregatus]
MNQNILIADDDTDVLSALSMLLKSEGYTPVIVNSPEQALQALRREDFELILMDLNYSLDTTSGNEGLKLISSIREMDELVPIVVMTGWGTIEVAVSIMKNGANDFIQKPWENDRLLAIIKNQTQLANSQKQSQKLFRQNQLLREEVSSNGDIIARSEAIRPVLETLKQVAHSDVSVLFTGENGTGKSMFARYLHDLSSRRNAQLISVNMGAVTESLFESEMFGHVKGSFTDAKSTRIGRFELADEGTLLLDEIANTPYSQQGKLLRVLEDSQFEKVGSSKTQTVNIRLITATNSDLNAAVKEGKFRKDLLYRINTIEIEIPPLRHRSQDIIPLANSFLKKVAQKYSKPTLSIDSSAESALKSYPWPGNVRELNHVMERAQILCQKSSIQVQDLGLNFITLIDGGQTDTFSDVKTDLRTISEIEEDIIGKRLTYFAGEASEAAKSLGLSRSAFYRKLQKSKN